MQQRTPIEPVPVPVPAGVAVSEPPKMRFGLLGISTLRVIVLSCFIGLVLLGLAWELWLAPLRPGGSWLALKVLPLVLALPALWRSNLRSFQWWSMLVLIYLTEGLVRWASDPGLGALLGGIESLLSAIAFGAILLFVRQSRVA
jgi:uncharacterized membrane protein